MRTINKFYYLLAAVALAGMVSCVKEKEEFTPGDPDSETCEGVYFIKQDVIEEMQIFDPTQEKKDRIVVARTNSDGAITVTPRVGLSVITSDGVEEGDASLFTVSDIVFADGQEESYVELEFSKVSEGVQYSLHLSIDGDEYSSKYSSSLKSCDYKLLCVAYKTFSQPKASEDDPDVPARVTFKHGWWKETRTALIKYYEVDGIRHCVTYDEKLADGEQTNGQHDEKGGFWGVDPDQHLSFLWYTADVEEGKCGDCDEGHPHAIPAGKSAPEGAELMTFDGFQEFDFGWSGKPVVVDYYYYQRQGGYSKGYLHFIDANDLFDNACYYDGNGGFYFWVLGYNTMADRNSGWSFPQDYDIVGIAEGFTRADYTLELTAGMPEPGDEDENVVPVDFEVGSDVDLVAYTILEGRVSSALVNNEATAIVKDTISRKYATWVPAEGKSFSDEITCPATGMYTLVAVAIDTVHVKTDTRATDADGVKYVFAHKNTASIYFKYLKAGDAGQVVLNVEAATTEGLESQGWSPETSLQYTIKGSGITGAIPLVYSQAEVEAEGGIEALVEILKSMPNEFYSLLSDDEFEGALSADQLASVNDLGLTSIYSSGLAPGTLYYVLVWATNGYDTTIEYATMTTTGDPLPIYLTYTVDSFKEEYMLSDASEWCGTWNMYGIMHSEDGPVTGLRTYLGKSVITPSDTPALGPDDDGFYDEFVDVTGMFGDFSWLEDYGIMGFDDTYEMDVYAGAMYAFTNQLKNDNIFGDCTVYLYSKGQGSFGWDYADQYWTCFIPVDDGYYALVDNRWGTSYNFVGYGVHSAEYEWLNMASDQLLVDPAKDDNGVANAPKHIDKAIKRAKASFANCVIKTENLGLGGKRAVRAAIKEYMKGYNLRNHVISVEEVKGLAPVRAIKRVEAGHKLSIVPPMTVKECNTPTVQFSARNI